MHTYACSLFTTPATTTTTIIIIIKTGVAGLELSVTRILRAALTKFRVCVCMCVCVCVCV